MLRAWGVDADSDGRPELLPGGEGRAFRLGQLVWKPADHVPHAEWLATTLVGLAQRADVRVVRPEAAEDGGYVVDGWTAWRWLEGEHRTDWGAVREAGERFHATVADVPRSPLLTPPSRWADADALAWRESDAVPWRAGDAQDRGGDETAHGRGGHDDQLGDELLRRLLGARRPVDLPCQLVHGDLTGNVLLHDELPPAVLDVSPYWRPTGYADAIVVADAMAWHHAPISLVEDHLTRHGEQLLLRALAFRIATDPSHAPAYRPVAELALAATR